MKRLLIFLILVALAIAGSAYYVSHSSWERGSAAADGGKLEALFPLEYGHLLETVTGTGLVQPQESLVVSTDQSGRVVKLLHDVNDVVAEGDELLQLDDRILQQKLKQAHSAVATQEAKLEAARAGVGEAEAKVKAAKVALEREQDALKRGSGSEKAVDSRKADVTSAENGVRYAEGMVKAQQAGVAEAKETVALAELAIQLTHVHVPVVERPTGSASPAGARDLGTILTDATPNRPKRTYTILERKVVLNQLVGPPVSGQLFVLTPNMKQLQVNAQIAEGDVHKVAPGQKVYFTVSAYENHYFAGTVTEVKPLPTVIAGSTTYTAVVTVDDQGGRYHLQPGMTTASLDVVTRTIPEGKNAGVWMVPDAAINLALDREFWEPGVKEAPSPEKKYVWIKDRGDNVRTARPVLIETGASGKVLDRDGTGLRAETYTEVKKWVSPTPPLEPGKEAPFEVISGAQPGKKGGLRIPSLFKS